jgi:hypothetical protein
MFAFVDGVCGGGGAAKALEKKSCRLDTVSCCARR